MTRLMLICAFLLIQSNSALTHAKTLRVPTDHTSIQSAIDAADRGDIVLVDAGRYSERVVLKDEVTLKSVGDDVAGKIGLLEQNERLLMCSKALTPDNHR